MNTYAIVTTDKHNYGHAPKRYDVRASTPDDAAKKAAERYGKDTGLASTDINTRNDGVVPVDPVDGIGGEWPAT